MPSYKIITLGCRVNHYESLQVQQLLNQLGYEPVTNSDDADVVIINTCAVTSSAAAKSRNLLRRHARQSTKTIAIGCWTTSEPPGSASLADNLILLRHSDNVAAQLAAALGHETPNPCHAPPSEDDTPLPGTVYLPQLATRQSLYQRALLKVQDGCDAHCTYCLIPKLRPILWTRPIDDVVSEARRMVALGHREIVLTGVFMGAYGQATALHRRQEQPGQGLAHLVTTLCQEVPGLLRLRLSSLEPGDVTPVLIDVLARHHQVMPHFHLPLQSGSGAILRKMNRQYSPADYRQMIAVLGDQFDRPAFTTDVIVGFPGETDDDFAQTLQMVGECKFLHVHAFPFSPREGTAAARWKRQMIQPRLITDRMHQLEALAAKSSVQYREQFVGQTVQVLVEHARSPEIDDADDSSLRCGRCERYFAVYFCPPPGGADLTGQLIDVRVDRISALRTFGTMLKLER